MKVYQFTELLLRLTQLRSTQWRLLLNRWMLLGVCLCGVSHLSLANGGMAEAFKEGVNYIPVKPAMVVNYGAGGNRVRYIKAEISMRVEDAKAAEEVAHHMPVIRDTLIMLFSSMTDEQVGSGQGKEDMRQEALKRVNEALERMEHPSAAKPDKEHEAATKDQIASKDDSTKSKSDENKSTKGNQEEHKALVSDLLFDNLVVQR